jgi:IS1 family transposase
MDWPHERASFRATSRHHQRPHGGLFDPLDRTPDRHSPRHDHALGARAGFGAIKFHDRTIHSLQVPRLELDEAWSFVGKKQRKCTPADGPFVGDQYVFLAASASSKAIVSFQVGKRNEANTKAFIWDLRERIINAPELSTDAFPAYEGAIEEAFGTDCRYGQIIKSYVGEPAIDAARRYSPGYVVAVSRRAVVGVPATLLARQSYLHPS